MREGGNEGREGWGCSFIQDFLLRGGGGGGFSMGCSALPGGGAMQSENCVVISYCVQLSIRLDAGQSSTPSVSNTGLLLSLC